jgi:acyl-CoA thioesterase-1
MGINLRIYSLILAFLIATPLPAATILCLGDSLTEGYGVPKSAAWPAVVEKTLRDKKHNVTLINAGISGSTTASGPSRLLWHLKAKPTPDWLILALGANDGLRGQDVQTAQKNLEKTIVSAKEKGFKKIILAGMRVPPSLGAAYAKSFDAMFPSIAKKHKVLFLPFLLDGVAAKPEMNLPDGIHPNVDGHQIIAGQVVKFLESHL